MADSLLIHEDDLDRFVAAFEAARLRDGQAELARFLPDRAHPLYLSVLRELVRVDLEFGWSDGEPRSLDEYQRRFPELFDDPASRDAITFEQRRLQEQADAGSVASGVSPSAPVWPKLGTKFAGFQLLSELGRGSFARVYLARQPGLADRLVALKVSSEMPGESKTLARLQHTNIVPVYSLHREGPLHVICMPFYGATTLGDVLHLLGGDEPQLPPSGRALVKTARACRTTVHRRPTSEGDRPTIIAAPDADDAADDVDAAGRTTTALAAEAPCWKALSSLSYVDAVLWIGSRLADGLRHAHERGVIHRDLKPANVLLADDGQPMLLDFNLSDDAAPRGRAGDVLGGTLPYMAPESLQAFQEHRRGGDARSDLYSLGVVLYELLTGHSPFPTRTGEIDELLSRMLEDRRGAPPRLMDERRGLTPAVESIVRRCLEPDPAHRYQSAAQLREDLDRHAQHLPLRHAPEPSWRERGRKWMRRHPRLTSTSSIVLVALLLFAALATRQAWQRERLARHEVAASLARFRDGVREAQVAIVDAPHAERKRLDTILATCRQPLEQLEAIHSLGSRLSPDDRKQLQADAAELYFLLAAVARLATDDDAPARALAWNDLALQSAALPAPRAFRLQRAVILESLGLHADAARLNAELASEAKLPPRSTRDACLLACWYMGQRRVKAALPLWRQATLDDPQEVWAWYGLGHCYARLEQPSQASAAFSACIALAPREHACYFHRGLAWLQQREFALAAADFTVALRLRPDHAESHLNRALARLGENLWQEAIADLEPWKDGPDRGRVLLLLAEAHSRLGRQQVAEQARAQALACPPHDAAAWIARAVARAALDPRAALADLDRALVESPHALAALESKAHLLAERLEQTDDAVRVLNVAVDQHPEHAAVRAARGVLLARLGQFDAARRDADEALALEASAAIEYQVAGVFALSSRASAHDRGRALELLGSALRRGFGAELVATDEDLAPLRDEPRFQELLRAVDTLRRDANSHATTLGALLP